MNTELDAKAGPDLEARFDAIRSRALPIGLAGLGISLAGALIHPSGFFPAYVAAFLFWTSVSLASIGLCLLHQLVGGGWALPLRRPMEAAGSLIVLMAVFFIPIVLGLGYAYAWADPAVVNPEYIVDGHKTEAFNHHVAAKTEIFLNRPAFLTRAVVYFAIWAAAAYVVNAWSREQDGRADDAPSRRLATVAGPLTVAMFLSVSFAAFDWGMSRDPDWYSTIYGAMFIVGSILSTLALGMVFTIRNSAYEPIRSALTVGRMNDVGNLLLAFTMLWAYMSFSQFLIIWLGNIPEEVVWYARRIHGIWGAVALGLIAFGFFAPFLALLQRQHKRAAAWVLPIATWILVMRTVDVAWLILPGYSKLEEAGFPWASVAFYYAALAGIGGVWVAAFLGRLRSAPLVPLRDPRIVAAVEHERAHESKHTGGAVL